jgi:hypothetical protein
VHLGVPGADGDIAVMGSAQDRAPPRERRQRDGAAPRAATSRERAARGRPLRVVWRATRLSVGSGGPRCGRDRASG